jgi:hypothetical protein
VAVGPSAWIPIPEGYLGKIKLFLDVPNAISSFVCEEHVRRDGDQRRQKFVCGKTNVVHLLWQFRHTACLAGPIERFAAAYEGSDDGPASSMQVVSTVFEFVKVIRGGVLIRPREDGPQSRAHQVELL